MQRVSETKTQNTGIAFKLHNNRCRQNTTEMATTYTKKEDKESILLVGTRWKTNYIKQNAEIA